MCRVGWGRGKGGEGDENEVTIKTMQMTAAFEWTLYIERALVNKIYQKFGG